MSYTPQRTRQDIIDRNLDLIRANFDQMQTLPLFQMNILQNVVINTTDTDVFHGLNRPYTGYIVTLRNANAVIFLSPTVNADKSLKIILRAGATVTADLWIF